MIHLAHRLDVRPRLLLATLIASISTVAIACAWAVLPAFAHVHHVPDDSIVSWYPRDCCSDGDCHPVSRIRALSDGLLMTTEEGTTLFVGPSNQRRPSHDNQWHICFGAHENPAVLCVFEPPSS
jgi:hypothetical protein